MSLFDIDTELIVIKYVGQEIMDCNNISLIYKECALTAVIKKVSFLVAKLKESVAFEETALLCFTILEIFGNMTPRTNLLQNASSVSCL